MNVRIAIISVLAFAACEGDLGEPHGYNVPYEPEISTCNPDLCEEGQQGRLTIGNGIPDTNTGIIYYRAIESGDEVLIEPGFQGGQHIWVVLRAERVESCWVQPRYQILDGSTSPVLDGYYGGEFYPLPDDDGVYEFLAFAAFIGAPERIHRRPTILRVEVSDGCGHLMTEEIEIMPYDLRLD
jgi:hypothetical protein